MDKLGIPVVLLVTMWGVFTPVLKAIEMLNERRDLVLNDSSCLDLKHRKLILYSDWVTLLVCTYMFVSFIGVIVCFTPEIAEDVSKLHWTIHVLFHTIGGILFVMGLGGLGAGCFDYLAMRDHLRRVSVEAQSVGSVKSSEGSEPEKVAAIDQCSAPVDAQSGCSSAPADPGIEAIIDAEQGIVVVLEQHEASALARRFVCDE
jgi:hypothetical protein